MEEFKNGDEVEGMNAPFDAWRAGKFVGKTSKGTYIVELFGGHVFEYKYCRKPKQSVEEWTNEWYVKNAACHRIITETHFRLYYEDRKRWEETCVQI